MEWLLGLAPSSAEPSFCLSAEVAVAAAVCLPRWLVQASCGLYTALPMGPFPTQTLCPESFASPFAPGLVNQACGSLGLRDPEPTAAFKERWTQGCPSMQLPSQRRP